MYGEEIGDEMGTRWGRNFLQTRWLEKNCHRPENSQCSARPAEKHRIAVNPSETVTT